MVRIGYTLLGEQASPKDLVANAVAAEQAGFDLAVASDHYFPWLDAQGHAPFVFSVLGAVAQATDTIDLMTYVTCPIKRYHPTVVAQMAATVDLLADGRFTLGLGSGENLNEHVTGGGWPPVNVRHEMLAEAIQIIQALFTGEYLSYRGDHYQVDSAKLWDVGTPPPKIGVAVSGPQSCELAGELADVMIGTEPKASLGEEFDLAGGAGKPRVGQVPVCYDPDRDTAVERAHELMRWFSLGWKVNSELPGTAAFAAASANTRPADVAESIACGPDVELFVEAVRPYVEAGYTEVALAQVGRGSQADFIRWAEAELLPELRKL
ncbi:TIGR03557 family F420-dependent LLM class oxidoreductase [Rhodococcus sp. X156]|uniref:TIGR03557 family F420-dependent LLM class oxidoreductase n=1 Tax=Rhodococcus sp. X156 TaxID=2499145 RepID=UPI000FDB9C12|nr:TIGR03557 family F420-dependent LLM class oxidoreductase [Rhodococcus sp. X156]